MLPCSSFAVRGRLWLTVSSAHHCSRSSLFPAPAYACVGVPDPTALAAFDWLVDEVEKMGGMQLMMTLTNGLSDYGGMQQYVR